MRRINALEAEARIAYVQYERFVGDTYPREPGGVVPPNSLVPNKRFGLDGRVYQFHRLWRDNRYYYSGLVRVWEADGTFVREYNSLGTVGGYQLEYVYRGAPAADGAIYLPHRWIASYVPYTYASGIVKLAASGTVAWYTPVYTTTSANDTNLLAFGQIHVTTGGDVIYGHRHKFYRLSAATGAILSETAVVTEGDKAAVTYERGNDTVWAWDITNDSLRAYMPSGVLKLTQPLPWSFKQFFLRQDGSLITSTPPLAVDPYRVFCVGPGMFLSVAPNQPLAPIAYYPMATTEAYDILNPKDAYYVAWPTGYSFSQDGSLALDELGHVWARASVQTSWHATQGAEPSLTLAGIIPGTRLTPNGGASVPADDQFESVRITARPIMDARRAITTPDHVFWMSGGVRFQQDYVGRTRNVRPLYAYYQAPTGYPYTWADEDNAANLYRIALGNGSAYGGNGYRYCYRRGTTPGGTLVGERCTEMDVGEIEALVSRLEGSSLL